MSIELPPKAQRLLDIIRAGGGDWVPRRDIAAALGKRRLNGGDLAYLEVLAANHLIEAIQRRDDTPIGYRWEYRAL